MQTSEQIDALATALSKAQGEVEGAKKGAENPAFKRDGKAMKYADLESVKDACWAALTANGLAIIQSPGLTQNGVMHMTTMLTHSSGQWVRDTLSIPLAKVDAQGYGSAVTYARRYSLAAFMGVAPEDDDGNAASSPASNAVANGPKRIEPPFPSGPARNLTDLKAKGRALWTDVTACEEIDQFDILLSENRDLMRQLKEAIPDWWNGGTKPGGDVYEGLGEVISKAQSDLTIKANEGDGWKTNPMRSG